MARRYWLSILGLLISGALIAVVLSRLDWGSFWSTLRGVDRRVVLAAVHRGIPSWHAAIANMRARTRPSRSPLASPRSAAGERSPRIAFATMIPSKHNIQWTGENHIPHLAATRLTNCERVYYTVSN